jgi:uncharacterized protein (DUF433 family)
MQLPPSSAGEKMPLMNATTVELLDRPVYGIAQVDRLLALKSGTARRWIDGYVRVGRPYPPVVRLESTGEEIVTWGEFVETRLLAEYRDAGVPMVRMRPAVERLREQFDTRYPLARARPFLDIEGRELVLKAQEDVHLEKALHLVVVRSGQVMLSAPTERFVQSVEYHDHEFAERLHPLPDIRHVVMDPLRQFGEPVVRSVPTEVIAEQVRAGDRIAMIAQLYDLSTDEVEEAVRYELIRGKPVSEAAA